MQSVWDSRVQRYMELAGPNVRLKDVPTPFRVEDAEKGPARAPCATGPISECPWCAHTFCPKVYKNLDELNRMTKKEVPTGTLLGSNETLPPGGGNSADPLEHSVKDPIVPEVPAPVAAFPHMREGKQATNTFTSTIRGSK